MSCYQAKKKTKNKKQKKKKPAYLFVLWIYYLW
jgi:hypothetical protein